MDYRTTYSGPETGHEDVPAYQVGWDTVTAILGRAHNGCPEDDAVLVAWLLDHGAPSWVSEASGWIDGSGWGIYRP